MRAAWALASAKALVSSGLLFLSLPLRFIAQQKQYRFCSGA